MTSVVASARTDYPTAIGAVVTATTLGGLVLGATVDDGMVLCPFRRCTGGYCPGCGATRSANRLLHGDLAGSWSQHPWVVLAALQLAVLAGALAVVDPIRRAERLRRGALPLLVANCMLMTGIWVARLSTDSIPTGWL